MNYPRITIIVPSFNQGQYIEKTITSILNQKYPNLELLIFDAESPDNTVDILKKYDGQIDFWVSEPDEGQSDAINKGLKRATGEVCNWLCSDDYLEPGCLHEIGEAFMDESINVVSGDIRVFDNDKIDYVKVGTKISEELAETIATSVNVQPATFFRLSHYKRSGWLNRDLHYFMDKELWIKYLLEDGQNGFKYLNRVIAHYLLHPQSKTFQEMDPDMYNPSSKFKIDNNTIFHSFAVKVNNKAQEKVITTLTDSILEGYEFKYISEPDNVLLKRVLNFYLYYEAKKNFYKSNFKTCKSIIASINKGDLPESYQKDLGYFKRKSLLKSIF